MTKDVLISVTGLQTMGEENENEQDNEPIEVITVGQYFFKNGHHFIKYDEVVEGFPGTTNNLIKVDGNTIEVNKKGITNVHMIFEEEKKNVTYYNTPYGNIQMGIAATKVDFDEQEDNIDLKVEYALELNEEHVADCVLSLNVKPRNSKDFSLKSE